MMKKLFIAFFLIIAGRYQSSAQLTTQQYQQLYQQEQTLKSYAITMIEGGNEVERLRADSFFIRGLVQLLKNPYSFYYPLDSCLTVSKVYAPDSTFRILTWEWKKDETYYRQRGAIQMNSKDGSLQLYPLLDYSEFTTRPNDSIRTSQKWIGAIYYNIVQKNFNNKNYYTLIGYDGNGARSNKKWIDVLSFDLDGKPQFGGRFLGYKHHPESAVTVGSGRMSLEYKKDAVVRMKYDEALDLILFEHLVSETQEPELKYTYIPDGDYEAWKWQNGTWVYVEKVFTQRLMDGQAPADQAILDGSGKVNEKKLEEISNKNIKKTPPKKEEVKPKKPGGGNN